MVHTVLVWRLVMAILNGQVPDLQELLASEGIVVDFCTAHVCNRGNLQYHNLFIHVLSYTLFLEV